MEFFSSDSGFPRAEQHLADIGSFDDVLHVQRLARLDDTGQVHQNGSVKAAADIEDGLAQRLEF
jgi:hypothetical protein